MDFIKMFEKTSFWTRPLSILAYLYRSRDAAGYILATYKKIKAATGASEPIIARVMTQLQADGIIKKVQNGVWMFVSDEH